MDSITMLAVNYNLLYHQKFTIPSEVIILSSYLLCYPRLWLSGALLVCQYECSSMYVCNICFIMLLVCYSNFILYLNFLLYSILIPKYSLFFQNTLCSFKIIILTSPLWIIVLMIFFISLLWSFYLMTLPSLHLMKQLLSTVLIMLIICLHLDNKFDKNSRGSSSNRSNSSACVGNSTKCNKSVKRSQFIHQ